MSVTKRTRFEVFRRDGYRCYYCGVRGNETTGEGLTVDHVTPVALGGSDDPSNLVSSCRDCNYGKSSTPADAETVSEVDALAAKYAEARAIALRALEADLDAESEYSDSVWAEWTDAAPSYAQESQTLDSHIASWFRQGVPVAIVAKAFRISWDGPAGRPQKATYAAGVIKKLMANAEDRTRALAAGDDVVFNAGYDAGFHDRGVFNEAFPEAVADAS